MMHIGVLQFSMEIPHSTSLKDKRRVINRLRDSLRRKFNISIAEIDDLDDRCTATLGVAMAGSDVPYVNGALDKLVAVLSEDRDAVLGEHQLEIFSPQ